MTTTIAGIKIPDSKMAREATQLVRDTESDLLFNHSRRVFLFGALTGERKQLKYDPELLYIGAMFHDMGLVAPYSSKDERFEVDSANAARDFLRQHGVSEEDVDQVWDAVALHTCWASRITTSATNSAARSCTRIRAAKASRKGSFMRSRAVSATSRTRRSAP